MKPEARILTLTAPLTGEGAVVGGVAEAEGVAEAGGAAGGDTFECPESLKRSW